MEKSKSRKISINTRILFSNLSLLLGVFLCIVLTFNLLVDGYIKKSTNEQLRQATIEVQHFDHKLTMQKPEGIIDRINPNAFGKPLPPDTYSDFLRRLQSNVKTKENKYILETMVIDNNYNLVFPTRKEDFLRDIDKYEDILSKIKQYKYNLNSEQNITVSTDDGSYYVSIVRINSLDSDKELYAVLFIDVSNILYLAKIMNIVLIIIMSIAGIFSVFIAILISKQIGSPIQKLSVFAKNMGEGNFTKCDFDFKDKELDQLSQVMNHTAEKLDEYDKEQKIFFQNASHELRTPLMSIKGYAEAIKYNVINKDEASDIILQESDRLTEMVEDLLYISKIDNITKDYISVECDLREVLSNCTLKQNARAINKGIEFKYDFEENPVLINCDEKSISRAFLNIIENGLRYAKKEITIGCKYDNNKIIVYIEDDGDGIKKQDLPYIFDRFYKGEKGKHGIGLSIVKSIIDKHHGNIYAENSSKGAKFIIQFNL